MCLQIKGLQHIPRIALRDITVYKVVKDTFNDGSYYTPYMCMRVQVGETYTAELIRFASSVEHGLHSFARLEDAVEELRDWKNNCPEVIRCIIPKGSIYYIGRFGILKSYASNKLRYDKVVTVTDDNYNSIICDK